MEQNSIKIIATQIAPEHQISPFEYYAEEDYAGIIFRGNKHLQTLYGTGTDDFEEAEKTLLDGYAHYFLTGVEESDDEIEYKTCREVIEDYFPRKNKYSDQEIEALKKAVFDYAAGDYFGAEEDALLEVLRVWKGQTWKTTTISGCCQGDWQNVFFRADLLSEKDIERLEKEYFNLGSEYMVRFADDPEGTEVSVYVHTWSEDEQKQEIIDCFGTGSETAENVQLRLFDHWISTPSYILA